MIQAVERLEKQQETKLYMLCFRPVGSGAAWQWSPHQKSAGREREKRKREERKRDERRRKREREREREERGRRARGKDVIWVLNTPLKLSKNYKRHGKKGIDKKLGKEGRRDRKGRRKYYDREKIEMYILLKY